MVIEGHTRSGHISQATLNFKKAYALRYKRRKCTIPMRYLPHTVSLHVHSAIVDVHSSTCFNPAFDWSWGQSIIVLAQSQASLPLLHGPLQMLQSSQVESHGVFQTLNPLAQQRLELDQGGPS